MVCAFLIRDQLKHVLNVFCSAGAKVLAVSFNLCAVLSVEIQPTCSRTGKYCEVSIISNGCNF